MAQVLLTILAHPDDAEFLCGGTLVRLIREKSWQVHIASMTAGDCGSVQYGPEEISRIRRREGAEAAALIGATYHCLEEHDLLVFYNERALEKVTKLLRQVRPSIVITHSPSDYMPDHEMTSYLARASAFAAPAPNFLRDRSSKAQEPNPKNQIPRSEAQEPTLASLEFGSSNLEFPPLEAIPHLYYADAVEGKDPLGRELPAAFYVDISGVIETKAQMLACHASQRDWLRKHHGMDHYVEAMRDWSAHQGQRCGVAYAEGFRQHLGHSYPQDNLLGSLLGAISVK
jgi:LmbE family N-acetylglucosaminyl deacetylase